MLRSSSPSTVSTVTSRTNNLSSASVFSMRTQRIYGVDVTSELIWKNWDIGGDYLKRIVVKNVSNEVLEVKYELPKSKHFFMGFPETSKICPGVSVNFDIRFRPLEKKNYSDSVKLTILKKGDVVVNIAALLPQVSLRLPANLDMGFCPTMETTRKEFNMTNVGETGFEFNWSVKAPFTFKPAYGKLNVGETTPIHVFFSPKDPSSFVSTAVCKLSSGDTMPLQLQGVGKVTHITTSETNLNFGKCAVNTPFSKTILIKNISLVTATVSVEPVENDLLNDVYSFEPKSLIIAPGASANMTVTYNPNTTETFDCNNYMLSTPGGNNIKITCSGYGIGPEVVISPMSINFGDVPAEKEIKRLITLENRSNIEAEYNIKADAEGIFRFDKTEGVVPPLQTRQITVYFFPKTPLNYYRRFFIIVKNQGVSFIDLLGTCFDSTRRPPPFTIKQVYMYKERVNRGLPPYSPAEIENYLDLSETGRLDSLSEEERENVSNLTQVLSNTSLTSELVRENIELTMSDYFNPPTNHTNPISINYNSLSFGSCSRFKLAEYKTVTLANRTNGKITCDVFMPTLDGYPSPFVVFPETVDIKPMSTFSFKVGFRPSFDNQFFASEIEFVCYFKANRSFRLVNEQTFVPPWTLPLRVQGNTFNNTAAFIPRYLLDPAQTLSFPACLIGDTSYRSFTIYNENDIPMPFEFLMSEAQRENFSCQPENGMVAAGSFKIIVFKFTPQSTGSFQENIKCILNDSPNHSIQIPLAGMSFVPSVSFGKDTRIFFKPTHVGTSTCKEITIHNPSRIPISYEWDIPKELASVFTTPKNAGVLKGNETQKIQWTFSPTTKKNYIIKVPCCVSSVAEVNGEPVRTRSYITLLGEGNSGGIVMEPENIDFGNILVKDSTTARITLLNSGECDLPYQLIAKERVDGEYVNCYSNKMVCESMRGVVPARSHKYINITYTPDERRVDSFLLFCYLDLTHQDISTFTDEQLSNLPKCEIIGVGTYPQLGITDIRCEGYSKADLWKQFSVNSINSELRKVSNSFHVDANITNFNNSIEILDKYSCDFGAKPLDSDDTIVYLTVENLGKLRCQFSMITPFDTLVDADKWAHEQVARTEDELRELNIFVNKLFEVYPNQGTLDPGQSMLVALIYRHKVVDIHTLPLLFQIRNGRCLAIGMTGQTLSYQQKHLIFSSMEHTFEDQEIGLIEHPIQYVKVYNPTNQDIEIYIDELPFKKISQENFDFEIITLENKKNIIPANYFVVLRFVFKPIEAKTYELSMPIHVVGTDLEYILTLRGKGVESTTKIETVDSETDSIVRYVPTGVPPLQPLKVPNQLVYLSSEVIDFDMCPSHSLNRRMISITNVSSTDSISFNWLNKLPIDDMRLSSVLDIEPITGTLKPLETRSCKLILRAGSMPQNLNCDICCEVTNLSQKDRKEERKKKYEEALLNTVKEDDVSDVASEKSILSIKEHFANPASRMNRGRIIPKATTKNTTKRESVISKSTISRDNHLTMAAYTTAIPRFLPISKTVQKTHVLERPSSAKLDKFGLKPIFSSKVYVLVNARIVPLDNFKYESLTKEEWDQQFIPQLYDNNFTLDNHSDMRVSVTSLDKNIFSDILSGMLQEIINDNELSHKALEDDKNSVFYCEIAETPRLSRPSSALPRSVSRANSTASLREDNSNTVTLEKADNPESPMPVLSKEPILPKQIAAAVCKNPLVESSFQKTLEWILEDTMFKIVCDISAVNPLQI